MKFEYAFTKTGRGDVPLREPVILVMSVEGQFTDVVQVLDGTRLTLAEVEADREKLDEERRQAEADAAFREIFG